jgi:radical SAM-linked protein
MDELVPDRVAVSMPSTRVDALSPKILEQIRRVRKTGFTLAPEAGTQRLRDVIQKEYREEELLDAARLFADLGWRSLKLYFMIGLPSETEEDVRGIVELAARVKRAAGGRLKVTASVSTFSPKPHTPFQWAGQLSIAETQARQTLLRGELRRRGIEFKWHDARLSWLEGVFARGDRRLADVIETAQKRGARFDGWSDHCDPALWEAALAEHGLDGDFYLRRRPLGETLPWDHLDAGLSKKFLQQDLARAVAEQLTPDCSVERCTYCGACDFATVRNVDYHPEGAKGSEHRGGRISRWAELLVPADDPTDPLPEWETRTWRGIRTRVAARRAARVPVATRPDAADTEAPLPASLAHDAVPAPDVAGEGNAEEWLGAVPSALAPTAPAAPVVQRVRVRYRKVGPARFIATRELGTVFLRAVRRAKLPIAFSQGHHPLPRIGFGPALPVGVSSEDELVDLELVASRDPAHVLAALARELPDGLEPIEASEIARTTTSIDRSTTAHVYDVDVTPLDAPPSAADVAAAVARFHTSDVLPIRKHTKHGERTIDGRRMVNDLVQSGPQQLTVELSAGPDGTLRPGVLVATLLDLPDDVVPLLRIHKRATRLTEPAAARAVAPSPLS